MTYGQTDTAYVSREGDNIYYPILILTSYIKPNKHKRKGLILGYYIGRNNEIVFLNIINIEDTYVKIVIDLSKLSFLLFG